MFHVSSTKALIAAVALSVAATTGAANAAPMTGGAKSISAAAATTSEATLTDVRYGYRRGYYRRGWGPGVGIGLGIGALAAGAAIAANGPYYRGYCDPYYEYCGPRRRVYYRPYYDGPGYYAPRRYYGRPYW